MKDFIKLSLLLICIVTGVALLYKYASDSPDSIESVLVDSGKEEKGSMALLNGYELPNIHSEFLNSTLIILIGGGLSAGSIFLILKKMTPSK
jgi:hypothetical protein